MLRTLPHRLYTVCIPGLCVIFFPSNFVGFFLFMVRIAITAQTNTLQKKVKNRRVQTYQSVYAQVRLIEIWLYILFFSRCRGNSLYGFASAGILPLTYGISSFLHRVYLGYIDGLIHACITILKPRFIILHHVLCNSFVFFLHCVQC